jgi:hypothetical protein
MGLTWKLKILIVLPFVLIIASAIIASKIDVKYEMTQEELQILGFEMKSVSLPKRKTVTERALKIPTLIEKIMGQRDVAPPPSAAKQKAQEVQLKVTMIIISEKGSMAIVNGTVVKEGDSVAGSKILQIESGRILVEYTITPVEGSKRKAQPTKGTKWINLS